MSYQNTIPWLMARLRAAGRVDTAAHFAGMGMDDDIVEKFVREDIVLDAIPAPKHGTATPGAILDAVYTAADNQLPTHPDVRALMRLGVARRLEAAKKAGVIEERFTQREGGPYYVRVKLDTLATPGAGKTQSKARWREYARGVRDAMHPGKGDGMTNDERRAAGATYAIVRDAIAVAMRAEGRGEPVPDIPGLSEKLEARVAPDGRRWLSGYKPDIVNGVLMNTALDKAAERYGDDVVTWFLGEPSERLLAALLGQIQKHQGGAKPAFIVYTMAPANYDHSHVETLEEFTVAGYDGKPQTWRKVGIGMGWSPDEHRAITLKRHQTQRYRSGLHGAQEDDPRPALARARERAAEEDKRIQRRKDLLEWALKPERTEREINDAVDKAQETGLYDMEARFTIPVEPKPYGKAWDYIRRQARHNDQRRKQERKADLAALTKRVHRRLFGKGGALRALYQTDRRIAARVVAPHLTVFGEAVPEDKAVHDASIAHVRGAWVPLLTRQSNGIYKPQRQLVFQFPESTLGGFSYDVAYRGQTGDIRLDVTDSEFARAFREHPWEPPAYRESGDERASRLAKAQPENMARVLGSAHTQGSVGVHWPTDIRRPTVKQMAASGFEGVKSDAWRRAVGWDRLTGWDNTEHGPGLVVQGYGTEPVLIINGRKASSKSKAYKAWQRERMSPETRAARDLFSKQSAAMARVFDRVMYGASGATWEALRVSAKEAEQDTAVFAVFYKAKPGADDLTFGIPYTTPEDIKARLDADDWPKLRRTGKKRWTKEGWSTLPRGARKAVRRWLEN